MGNNAVQSDRITHLTPVLLDMWNRSGLGRTWAKDPGVNFGMDSDRTKPFTVAAVPLLLWHWCCVIQGVLHIQRTFWIHSTAILFELENWNVQWSSVWGRVRSYCAPKAALVRSRRLVNHREPFHLTKQTITLTRTIEPLHGSEGSRSGCPTGSETSVGCGHGPWCFEAESFPGGDVCPSGLDFDVARRSSPGFR